MEEQKLLKKQFVLHIIYNMIAFAVIFILFGILMFVMVRNITFSSVDKQLIEAQNEFNQSNIKKDSIYSIFGFQSSGIFESILPEFDISNKINNPNITLILRLD